MKSKIKFLKQLQWLLLITGVIAMSCKKDEEVKVSEEFFNDGNHIFNFECRGDKIEFSIDALIDTTDAVGGVYPDLDFYGIYVDYNRNGVVDSGIDLSISFLDFDKTCVSILLSPTSSKPCEFYDDVYGEEVFSSTENSDQEHVSFKLTVPKDLISDSNEAHFIIRVYDSDATPRRKTFPTNNPLFRDPFKIAW